MISESCESTWYVKDNNSFQKVIFKRTSFGKKIRYNSKPLTFYRGQQGYTQGLLNSLNLQIEKQRWLNHSIFYID